MKYSPTTLSSTEKEASPTLLRATQEYTPASGNIAGVMSNECTFSSLTEA